MVGQSVAVNPVTIVLALAKFVILPLILAQLLRPVLIKYPNFVYFAATILLIAIIWGIVAPTRSFLTSYMNYVLLIFGIVAIIMMASFLLGWLVGKKTEDRITYSISASYKNFTLSTVIAFSIFGEVAAIASIAYTILNNVLFAIMHAIVSRKE